MSIPNLTAMKMSELHSITRLADSALPSPALPRTPLPHPGHKPPGEYPEGHKGLGERVAATLAVMFPWALGYV